MFEVKPEINRQYLQYAGKKIASVRQLHRTSVPFGWAMGEMPARELPPILGGFLAARSGCAPAFGDPFRHALNDVTPDGAIDLGCVLNTGSFEVPVNGTVDDVSVSDPSKALISFTLTLLKRLQGLGSVPGIDYEAYAAWISSRTPAATGPPPPVDQ